ncbi:Metallo beta lactamase domain containing protein [Fasciolopsis buskii]|uniref:Metallo beta lactamase domain containing protein n=1 Tax=Fasciolopsis buskii TaxID=27845 RepID=A0A8E0RKW4_9TREM|nr:Metallo beta lactamase domain containing protein [Fasciolopsis buski]
MSLPPILPLSTIGPLVTRILGHNPGPFTLQGTNSYLVGYPHLPRVLIDTTSRGPGLSAYLHHLSIALGSCSRNMCPISGIILTHWHPDHVQAVPDVLNLARQFVNRSDETVIPVYKYPGGPNLKALEFYKGPLIDLHDDSVIALPNGQSNELPPAQLHVHSTPGHSDDHICLLLRANNRPVHLFVGDLILGHGSTTVHDLEAYMNSLGKTRCLVSRCEQEATRQEGQFTLCPGHGLEVDQCVEKVDEYIANRKSRIDKTREFFTTNQPGLWFSEDQILPYVYPDVNEALRMAARINLRHSLFWLAAHRSESAELGLDLMARRQCDNQVVSAEEFRDLLVRLEEKFRMGDKVNPDHWLNEKLLTSWQWTRKSQPVDFAYTVP